MVRNIKLSLVAAAIAAAVASRADASLNLDLRFGPTGQPAGAAISADGKTADMSSPGASGTYTLQLWAQITDPTHAWQTDSVTVVHTGLQSSQVGGGLFNGGGVTGAALASTASSGGAGTGPTATSVDGVADWGTYTTSAGTGWLTWSNSNGSGPIGYIAGTTVAGLSQLSPTNSDVWEILLATYTVDASHLGGPGSATNFLVTELDKYLTPPSTKSNANTYYQDGVAKGSNTSPSSYTVGGLTLSGDGSSTTNGQLTAGPGVSFAVVPEPASLGLLTLGGLALLARRRRA